MGRQLWLDDVVADAFRGIKGYRVETYSGWSTRGSTSYDPIGVMNHHTGPGSYNNLLNYMAKGSSIAPLCNIATSRPENGIVRITIVTAGRANHAGVGNYSWIGANNGNYRTIGIENQNSGSQAWPQQQVEGIRILTAALLKHMGRDERYMVDHKTYGNNYPGWPNRKVDRYNTSLNVERREVANILQGTPTPPAPAPEPVDPWEEFMESLTSAEQQKLKDFAGYLVEENVSGRSFASALLDHFRTMRDLVAQGNTSLQGVVIGGVNTIDAIRDLGYEISTRERTGVRKTS